MTRKTRILTLISHKTTVILAVVDLLLEYCRTCYEHVLLRVRTAIRYRYIHVTVTIAQHGCNMISNR